jgi:hypothetical protein
VRRISKRRQERQDDVRDKREGWVREAGACMVCGSKRDLACHEILNGPLRAKTLDEPCSLLVVCWSCNSGPLNRKGEWPVARQLAVLKRKAPHYYDIVRFNWLRNPNAPNYVTEDEVNEYDD